MKKLLCILLVFVGLVAQRYELSYSRQVGTEQGRVVHRRCLAVFERGIARRVVYWAAE